VADLVLVGPDRFMRVMRAFLWIAVIGWAIGLGAKLFDLVVVAGAWSASPPASFALLPYGKSYPIDPGDFFLPLSVLMAICSIGALISGWKSHVRLWLWLPVVIFFIIWAITPTVFWPMIRQLYGTAIGRIAATDTESVRLAHRWLVCDSFRVVLIAIGFIASVRALSLGALTKKH
jgi:hypothetical protein